MPEVIEFKISPRDLESCIAGLLKDQVFHFTSGKKWALIQECGKLIPNEGHLQKTSIYSNESVGRHLKAICLFDLRDKTPEQIAPAKSYYDYLAPRIDDSLVYLILGEKHYSALIQIHDLEETIREGKMYLPEIESWYPGPLDLQRLARVLIVELTDSQS